MNDKTKQNDKLRIVPLRRAAEMIGVSPRTVYRLTHSGALPTVRLNDRPGVGRWVSISTVCEFIAGGGVPHSVTPINC